MQFFLAESTLDLGLVMLLFIISLSTNGQQDLQLEKIVA
jgi:hypothetical protein